MPAEAAEGASVGRDSADIPAVTRSWAVYMLGCDGGKSYIGISPRPHQRFELHRAGRGAAFTRANRPQTLEAVVWFEDRSAAAAMEPRLKALARLSKLEWFASFRTTTAVSPATLAEGVSSLDRL